MKKVVRIFMENHKFCEEYEIAFNATSKDFAELDFLTFTSVNAESLEGQDLMNETGLNSYPMTLLLEDGKVLWYQNGVLDFRFLSKKLNELLSEEHKD